MSTAGTAACTNSVEIRASFIQHSGAGFFLHSTMPSREIGVALPAEGISPRTALPAGPILVGPAFSKATLIRYAYDFEQIVHRRKDPPLFPSLPAAKMGELTTFARASNGDAPCDRSRILMQPGDRASPASPTKLRREVCPGRRHSA